MNRGETRKEGRRNKKNQRKNRDREVDSKVIFLFLRSMKIFLYKHTTQLSIEKKIPFLVERWRVVAILNLTGNLAFSSSKHHRCTDSSGGNSNRESEGFDFMQSKQAAEDPPSKLIGQFLHEQKASAFCQFSLDLYHSFNAIFSLSLPSSTNNSNI